MSEAPPEPSRETIHAQLSKAAYGKEDPAHGYQLDTELSNRDRKVYHKDGKAVVAYRGTNLSGSKDRFRDLAADGLIALGLTNASKRFKGANDTADKALQKYGKENVSLTGHSLGGSQALHVAKKHKDLNLETHAYNPGISPVDVVRSKGIFHPRHLLKPMGGNDGFGSNTTIHAVRKDLVGALSPYLSGVKTKMYTAKKGKGAHALANFGV